MRRAVTDDSYDNFENDDDAPTVPTMEVANPWREDFRLHEEQARKNNKLAAGATSAAGRGRTNMVVTCNDCRRRMKKSDRDGRSPFLFLLPSKVHISR